MDKADKANNDDRGLKLEQQFELRVFQETVKSLDKAETQDFLVKMLREMMIKGNMIKSLLLSKL